MCPAPAATDDATTAYDFSFARLGDAQPLNISEYKGRVVLVVNTASRCGFTGQYAGLEALYKTYRDRGLIVLGVPSNDFGAQEPGDSGEIANFCETNYAITFPMAAKEAVTGNAAHPFYVWAQKTLGFGSGVKWNFHKYLVGRDGRLVDYFYSTTSPDAGRLIKAIESALAAQ